MLLPYLLQLELLHDSLVYRVFNIIQKVVTSSMLLLLVAHYDWENVRLLRWWHLGLRLRSLLWLLLGFWCLIYWLDHNRLLLLRLLWLWNFIKNLVYFIDYHFLAYFALHRHIHRRLTHIDLIIASIVKVQTIDFLHDHVSNIVHHLRLSQWLPRRCSLQLNFIIFIWRLIGCFRYSRIDHDHIIIFIIISLFTNSRFMGAFDSDLSLRLSI